MIYGILFGLFGVISFVHTNNKLQKKYYCKLADSKDEWKISKNKIDSLNESSSWFPLNPYSKRKYTKLQKIHYLLSLIMFVVFNCGAFEIYMNGYTKLHLNHNHLIYMPIDIFISLFINNFFYYYYHRLVHTKYLYKYIHRYHHAFLNPEPFDSLIGHPIDHTCAAICQISPMFIYRMHLISFLVYSSILSLMGVWDHSGIKFSFWKYTSIEHHIHHMYPSKNFATGFAFDRLHGTYQSTI